MYDQIKLSETVNDLCDAQINPINNLNHLNQEDVMVIWFLNKRTASMASIIFVHRYFPINYRHWNKVAYQAGAPFL